jgi:ribonucleoside-diphosphate reductase alpha subunit
MERVEADADWSTFDPDECPGLTDCYGESYKKLYLSYETAGKSVHTYRAREIWKAVFTSQKESGMPYMLYKDNVNHHNNQSNMGVIKSSNLCCEITIYSDAENYGVCVLGSICLPKFIKDTYSKEDLMMGDDEMRKLNDEFPVHPKIDYDALARTAGILCKNLNKVIDKNLYPCPEAKSSSIKGRPIGIGVQGLADVFYKFKTPFDGELAKSINKKIFEAIHFGALTASTQLAKIDGAYPKYKGSPLDQGKFHWEMYELKESDLSGSFNWDVLRQHIKTYGVRNSLLTALMPTASTSHLNGNIECFEPITSNVYKRKVLSGEFIIMNKYSINDLVQMGLWDQNMINYLKISGGSIQNIEGLPDDFKKIYRTVWEVPQKSIIDMCVDRQPFVDQAQSMNLFFQDFTFSKFHSAQFHAWKNKLKTGSYYIRTQASVSPQKFTVNPDDHEALKNFEVIVKNNVKDNLEVKDDAEICILCSA